MMFLLLSASTMEADFAFVDLSYLVLIGVLIQIVFLVLFYKMGMAKFQDHSEALNATTTLTSQRTGAGIIAFFLALGITCSVCGLGLYYNVKYDTSQIVIKDAKIREGFPDNNNPCAYRDFLIADEDTDINFRVCRSDYEFVEPGTNAKFNYRKGALGFRYAYGLVFPSLETMDAYLASGIQEKDLRQMHVLFYLKKDKTPSFKTRMDSWQKDCEATSGYQCRLLFYVLEEQKQLEKGLGLLKKSCGAGMDPIACRNLVRNDALPKEHADFAKKQLKADCDKGSLESCSELGWSLMFLGNYDKEEVISLLDRPCKSGDKDACKSIDSLK